MFCFYIEDNSVLYRRNLICYKIQFKFLPNSSLERAIFEDI